MPSNFCIIKVFDTSSHYKFITPAIKLYSGKGANFIHISTSRLSGFILEIPAAKTGIVIKFINGFRPGGPSNSVMNQNIVQICIFILLSFILSVHDKLNQFRTSSFLFNLLISLSVVSLDVRWQWREKIALFFLGRLIFRRVNLLAQTSIRFEYMFVRFIRLTWKITSIIETLLLLENPFLAFRRKSEMKGSETTT